MVKYLLVEDERFAYEELKRMMQRLRPSWQLAGWAESVEQAVLLLRQGSLDLMIVDIRLSDGLSFEIFEQCPVDLPVIFTTAYDEYAIKAFKVNSIDYLLKPIEESDLKQPCASSSATVPSVLRLPNIGNWNSATWQPTRRTVFWCRWAIPSAT